MDYKIVRDSGGNVVAFGPMADGYDPVVPPGGSVTVADESTIAAQINAMRDAANAELADRQATIDDPMVQAVATMTRAEIKTHIDNTFPAMTAGQRQVLKAMALAARFAIRKG
jgi:hypothetical protein